MEALFWRILIAVLTSGAVVGMVMGLIFGFRKLNLAKLKAWIAANDEAWTSLKNLAYDAVIAAQQIFDDNGEKKAYVIKFLSEHSKMSEADITAAIEEAVKIAKKEFGTAWDKIPTPPAAGFQPSA